MDIVGLLHAGVVRKYSIYCMQGDLMTISLHFLFKRKLPFPFESYYSGINQIHEYSPTDPEAGYIAVVM